ncbi:MAG: hypothetical protein ABH883_05545 [Candidatus Omnitrophota bacterium]
MKKRHKKNYPEPIKDKKAFLKISRGIFVDLSMESISRFVFMVVSALRKTKDRFGDKYNLDDIGRSAASLMKNTEAIVQAKAAEQELAFYERFGSARDILMKKYRISRAEAVEKIESQSRKLSKSVYEISRAIIVAEEIEKKASSISREAVTSQGETSPEK